MAHKASCALFVLISVIGTLMSVQMLFNPMALVPMLTMTGQDTAPLLAVDAAPLAAFLGRWVATALVGCNVFSLVVALTALRRREPWAAWVMLYWPLNFGAHLLMYAPGPMRVVQIVWICLTVPALVVLVAHAMRRTGVSSTSPQPSVAPA